MKKIAILALASISMLQAFDKPIPMEDKKPVAVESGFLGTKYKQDAKLLQPFSMHRVLSAYPESKDAVSSAKLWTYPGLALGGVGGFLIGYQAVQPMVGGEFNAPVFFVGLGAAGIGLFCDHMAQRNLKRAVESYNRALGGASLRWDLRPDGGRLGLAYAF